MILDYTGELAVCGACGALMRWTQSAKSGKPMPLNAHPDPDRGNVRRQPPRLPSDPELAIVIDAHNARMARARGTELYISHHATCPSAEEYRRGNRALPRGDR